MHNKKLYQLEGVALILLGLAAVLWPTISSLAAEIMIGWLLVVGGFMEIIHYFRLPEKNKLIFSFFIGFLYIFFGAIILVFTREGLITLTFVLALLFLLQGVSQFIMASKWKTSPTIRVWFYISGILAICLALLIWLRWPSDSSWILGLFMGINLIFFGFTTLLTAREIDGKK